MLCSASLLMLTTARCRMKSISTLLSAFHSEVFRGCSVAFFILQAMKAESMGG